MKPVALPVSLNLLLPHERMAHAFAVIGRAFLEAVAQQKTKMKTLTAVLFALAIMAVHVAAQTNIPAVNIRAVLDQLDSSRDACRQTNGMIDVNCWVQGCKKIDTSSCPADFQSAFQNWIKVADEAASHNTVLAFKEVFSVEHGIPSGDLPPSARELRAAYFAVRDVAVKYGTPIRSH